MKSTPVVTVLLVLISLCTLATPGAARTWYIKADGTGDVPTIQTAVDSAAPGDLILVAAGHYTWTNQGGTDFGMIHIARFREHFTMRSESGPEVTILDAERQGRVFFIDGLNFVEIDGFTVTGGLAPAFGDYTGGGMAIAHTTDVVKNCIIEDNEAQQGGGIFVGGTSSIRIEDCVIRNNKSTINGGGMWFAFSQMNMTVSDCVVYNNRAQFGGGIFSVLSALTIENTVIVKNTATVEGGGFYARDMWSSTMRGCTVSSNWAPTGSAAFFENATPINVSRTIFSFSGGGDAISLVNGAAPKIGCSCIFGNVSGDDLPAGVVDNGNNFSEDPRFCNAPFSSDPTLNDTSPCLPGNHPAGASCGLIGARSTNCSIVPVEERSWGYIKALYR